MKEQNEVLRTAIKGTGSYSTPSERRIRGIRDDNDPEEEEDEENKGGEIETPVKMLIEAGKSLKKIPKECRKATTSSHRSRHLRERFKNWQFFPDGRLGSQTPETFNVIARKKTERNSQRKNRRTPRHHAVAKNMLLYLKRVVVLFLRFCSTQV